MLHFDKLEISDFGPFEGEQCIDFTKNPGVIIIWGSNGRGKTTLLNIFNFALFGTIKTRHGNARDYLSIINSEAKQKGHYSFSISLYMTNDDNEYLLTRTVHPREGIQIPINNGDFIEDVFLKKNTSILSAQEREHELGQIMPEDIARFFLFDGELLQQYENLLDEDSPDSILIKSSIEKILGMPILTNGLADISDLSSDYITAKNKAAQNDINTKDYANRINILMDEIRGHNDEYQRLQSLLNEEQANLLEIKSKMDETERLRELLANKSAKEQAIQRQKSDAEELRNNIQTEMKTIWQAMVHPVVTEQINNITSQLTSYSNKQFTADVNDTIIKEIESAIKNHHCDICDQEVNSQLADALEIKLRSLREATPSLTPEEQTTLDTLQDKLNNLRSISLQDDTASIKVLMSQLNKLENSISKDEQSLSDLDREIKTYGDYDPSTQNLTNEYSKCQAKISEYNQGILNEQNEAKKAEDKRQKLDEKVSKLSNNKDVITANSKLEICQEIESIFSKGVDKYRARLKEQVQSDASALFKKMSADQDYERLLINDNYGLEIIHKSGEKVIGRSAGFEHVVALSLIGALHKNAPLQGPVIMDSPFGRLDPTHKRNVTKSLPSLSKQVILLVYEGEINPSEARELLGGNLIKEYHLEKVTSFNTMIV